MFSWQKAEWPIPERTEISSAHFEDLRLFMLLLENLRAGHIGLDYDSPITAATWEAYVDDIPYPGETDSPPSLGLERIPAGWDQTGGVKRVVYRHDGSVSVDVYCMIDTYGLTRTQLKANPPTNSEGELNAFWKHAADPDRITDYDKDSGRWITEFNSGPDGSSSWYEEYSSLSMPAWRWAMIQTDPARQREPIKYLDTERVIPHRQDVTLSPTHITHSASMGPNFGLSVKITEGNVHYETKEVSGKEVGIAGYQYGVQNGQPNAVWGDHNTEGVQYHYEPKRQLALQSQIERAVTMGGYVWPTKDDEEYFENWRQIVAGGSPIWDPETSYTYGQTVVHNPGGGTWAIFSAEGSTTGHEPNFGESYPWSLLRFMPSADALDSVFWGCNESAFELLIKKSGTYSLWLDTEYPWIPSMYLVERSKMQNHANYPISPTPEDVEAAWPLAAGTLRYTWPKSMGGPKDAYEKSETWPNGRMWPQNMELPEGDTYGTEGYHFPGIYFADVPELEVTSVQREVIEAAHGPIPELPDAMDYELTRDIMNKAWELLLMCGFRLADLNVQLQDRRTSGGVPSEYETYEEAWQAIVAAAKDTIEPLSFGSADPVSGAWFGLNGLLYGTSPTIGGFLQANGYAEARLRVTGGEDDGLYVSDHFNILVIAIGYPYVSPGANRPDVALRLPDGEILNVEMSDGTGSPILYKSAAQNVSLPVPEEKDEINYFDFTRAGVEPVQDQAGEFVSGCFIKIRQDMALFFTLNLDKFPEGVFDHAPAVFREIAEDNTHFDNDGFLGV